MSNTNELNNPQLYTVCTFKFQSRVKRAGRGRDGDDMQQMAASQIQTLAAGELIM